MRMSLFEAKYVCLDMNLKKILKEKINHFIISSVWLKFMERKIINSKIFLFFPRSTIEFLNFVPK